MNLWSLQPNWDLLLYTLTAARLQWSGNRNYNVIQFDSHLKGASNADLSQRSLFLRSYAYLWILLLLLVYWSCDSTILLIRPRGRRVWEVDPAVVAWTDTTAAEIRTGLRFIGSVSLCSHNSRDWDSKVHTDSANQIAFGTTNSFSAYLRGIWMQAARHTLREKILICWKIDVMLKTSVCRYKIRTIKSFARACC